MSAATTGVWPTMSPRNATSAVIASVPSAPTLPLVLTTNCPASMTNPSCQIRRCESMTRTGSGLTRMSTTLSPIANRGSSSPWSRPMSATRACAGGPGVTSSRSKCTCPANSPPSGSASGIRAPAASMLTRPLAWVDWAMSGAIQRIQRSQNWFDRSTLSTMRPGGTTSSMGPGTSRSHGPPRSLPPAAPMSNGPKASWPSRSLSGISPPSIGTPPTCAASQARLVSNETARIQRAGSSGVRCGNDAGIAILPEAAGSVAASTPRAALSQSSGRTMLRAGSLGGGSIASRDGSRSGPRIAKDREPDPASITLPPVHGMRRRESEFQS